MKNPQLDLFKVSDRVFAKYFKTGLEDLAEPERVFICLWQLEAQVNNGGFHQFYFNSSGNLARDTVSSLQAIGAEHTANLVRKANALFGKTGPSSEWSERQEQLEALGDSKTRMMDDIEAEFMHYTDKLGQLLEAYVLKNAAAFSLM